MILVKVPLILAPPLIVGKAIAVGNVDAKKSPIRMVDAHMT
eukprot:CAMPEP_0117433868 /NCGR_PEP_ID=MMETSP0758-20121206/13155_1 /TAXON_ID=63605 /ORGANISM="Percolomonas cosmopolitus, Strain AE-1 (ATCC 50343)" /LENGTH=40 /DNA_ID= /DNA_START= /DNA_END= /DNA_ORIENTATION=